MRCFVLGGGVSVWCASLGGGTHRPRSPRRKKNPKTNKQKQKKGSHQIVGGAKDGRRRVLQVAHVVVADRPQAQSDVDQADHAAADRAKRAKVKVVPCLRVARHVQRALVQRVEGEREADVPEDVEDDEAADLDDAALEDDGELAGGGGAAVVVFWEA